MLLDAASCQLYVFFMGVVEVYYMSNPVGQCQYCCQRDGTTDIQYHLYTRSNPDQSQLIRVGNAADLRQSSFNANNPTIIYLHGFSDSGNGQSARMLREAHFSVGDFNFIVVDWARLVAFPWYIVAVQNTRYMGIQLANFVEFLDQSGVPASSLQVIGFSLGAEAAGFAGKELNRRGRGVQIGRITGLDPAYPLYSLTNQDNHLSKGDAAFVDVVHTNPGVFGFPQAIGDVDFYVNPGQWIQPGCWWHQLFRNRELNYLYGCSHNRAWRLYAESVGNPRGFPATRCRDWKSAVTNCRWTNDGFMGILARPPMAGNLYLETNERPPFAKNGP